MFAYCRNNPASRIDISGTADEVCYNNNGEIFDNNDLTGLDGGGGMKSTYVSGVTNHSNGGNGTGSMIGDIAYIDAKAAATTYIPTWGWEEVFAFISSLFSGQSSNHSQCFVEGTLVQTAEGTTAIENIEVGDYVWAWDEASGDVALKEVVETYVNQTCELIHVFVNGEEIVTTPEHPFYSPVKGWTSAVHLRAGDILVLVNGEYVVVEKIQHEILESPVKVYNFQVEGYHTYYVTSIGVLVHNKCPQRLVAGDTNSWNARVTDGGQQDHNPPHAHIYYKSNKLGSVTADGTILNGYNNLGSKGRQFVQQNIVQISEGIKNGGDKMNTKQIHIDAYAMQLLSSRNFLNSEYRKFIDAGYALQNVEGFISKDILKSVISKAKRNQKLRKMLTDILLYVNKESISDENFRLLLKFRGRYKITNLSNICHADLAFYQMQIINRYPVCFEAFAWLFDHICRFDFFKGEDMLQILRENPDITSDGIQACIDCVLKDHDMSPKLLIAKQWVEDMRSRGK